MCNQLYIQCLIDDDENLFQGLLLERYRQPLGCISCLTVELLNLSLIAIFQIGDDL